MNKKTEKKPLPFAMKIFIALILAVIAGLLMQDHAQFAEDYIKPFGTIFLNLVKFIVGDCGGDCDWSLFCQRVQKILLGPLDRRPLL